MPKRMVHAGKRGRSSKGGRLKVGSARSDTSTQTFHALISLTAVAGVFPAQSVAPTIFNRGSSEQDIWDEFECTGLKYRVLPGASAPTQTLAVAFFPGVTTTVPTANGSVWDNPTTHTFMHGQTNLPGFTSVARSLLRGEQSRYKCEGSATNPDQIPGQILGASASSTTDQVYLEVFATFRFTGQANANNTPEAIALRQRLRDLRAEEARQLERRKLLILLEDPTIGNQTPYGAARAAAFMKWPVPAGQ